MGIIREFRLRSSAFFLRIKRSMAVLAGCLLAVFSIGFTANVFAETNGFTPELGNLSSLTEVYVFSDWFCPACRKAEPELEKAFPDMAKRCKIIFADFPTHRESMNFMPYSISFAVQEKNKYMETRKALFLLSEKTTSPTPEDVRKAVAPAGLKLSPMKFADVNLCVQYYAQMAQDMQIDSTPTVVVFNRKTKVVKKLVGSDEITRSNILELIDRVTSR